MRRTLAISALLIAVLASPPCLAATAAPGKVAVTRPGTSSKAPKRRILHKALRPESRSAQQRQRKIRATPRLRTDAARKIPRPAAAIQRAIARRTPVLGRSDRLSDLARPRVSRAVRGRRVDARTADELRKDLLADFALGDLVVTPGHRVLSSPRQIDQLTQHIHETSGRFEHDPLIVNITTQDDGEIQSVDIWNGHHRFVAYLEAGYRTLGQVPRGNLAVLINGETASGEHWQHFLPAAGLELDQVPFERTHSQGSRSATVAVSGRLSNFELGSRTSLRQLRQNTRRKNKPKIAVYLGTFDPIHAGHVDVFEGVIEDGGLDEVVLIANGRSGKATASEWRHRDAMVALQLEGMDKVNRYAANTAELVQEFGRNALVDRIGQIYGTDEVYEIMGQDAYDWELGQGSISPDRRYFIVPRGDRGPVFVPEYLRDSVFVSRRHDERNLSSTRIRGQLRDGRRPEANEVKPAVMDYAEANGLFR